MAIEIRQVIINLPRMVFREGDTFHLCSIPAGARILSVPTADDVLSVAETGGNIIVVYEVDVGEPMTISIELPDTRAEFEAGFRS